MADKKDTQLTSATPALADIITFVDSSEPVGTENRKCTIAELLIALRLKQGESNSAVVSAGVLKAFIFSAAIGTAVDGSDYDLIINCVDKLNETELIGRVITNRTELGFEITPVADAYISFTAILL